MFQPLRAGHSGAGLVQDGCSTSGRVHSSATPSRRCKVPHHQRPPPHVSRPHAHQQQLHAQRGNRQRRSAASPAGVGGELPLPPTPALGAGPLTPEELLEMSQREADEAEAQFGNAWRSLFQGDVRDLYEYADRDAEDYSNALDEYFALPSSVRDSSGLGHQFNALPAGMAADVLGMGTWRLKGAIDPVIEFMVGRLENSLRELLPEDMCLYPRAKWKARGWDFIDSMDLEREWDGFAFVDIPNPERGEEGYPRLQVENRVYASRAFRKIHLEVALRQDELHVLHMVLYPRYDVDCPILALDLVAVRGNVTLAIVDACPLSERLQLPTHYLQTMTDLQREFLPPDWTEGGADGGAPAVVGGDDGGDGGQGGAEGEGGDGGAARGGAGARSIPEWGRRIFSPLCVCMRPRGAADLAGFVKYAVALTRAHLMYSRLLVPIEPRTRAAVRRLEELVAGHQRFCEQQRSNKKTLRVLEAALGKELADAYVSQLMFDFDPSDSPPWFDASLVKLYDHFEERPEVWPDAGEFLRTRMSVDMAKARETLQRFVAGDEGVLKGERLDRALQTLYDADPSFREGVEQTLPSLPQLSATGTAGAELAMRLAALVGAQLQTPTKEMAAEDAAQEQAAVEEGVEGRAGYQGSEGVGPPA